MPRRRREDKRRVEHHDLDLLAPLAATDLRGCAAIPADVSVDDLYGLWLRLHQVPTLRWAHRAFQQGLPRPCEGMVVPNDPYDLNKGRKLKCRESVCRFEPEVRP